MDKKDIRYFSSLLTKLEELGTRHAGKQFTASELTTLIRRQLPSIDFIVRTTRDTAVDPDMVVVSGLYDNHDDKQKIPSITITLCYHPVQDVYFVDLLNWKQFSFDIAECVGHELVHRKQHHDGSIQLMKPFRSKHLDGRIKEDQEYLGADDEIEAYGFSIASEMHTFKKPINECIMYNVYRATFETDPQIVTRLEKHVDNYYERLEQEYEQSA